MKFPFVICLLFLLLVGVARGAGRAGPRPSPPRDSAFALAETAFGKGHYREAVRRYAQSARRAAGRRDWDYVVHCHRRLATCYERQHRGTERLAAASAAFFYARQYLPRESAAYALSAKEKGDAFFGLGQADSAAHYLALARPRLAALRDHPAYVACDLGLAACAYYAGRPGDMESLLDRAHAAAGRHLSAADDHFATLFQLYGVLYQHTGDFDRGLRSALAALDHQLALPAVDSLALANDYNLVGVLYDEKGDWDRAYGYFRQALDVYRRHHPAHFNLVDVYNNLGQNFFERGDYAGAALHLRQGWRLAQRQEASRVADKLPPCLNTLAAACLELGRPDSAAYYLGRLFGPGLENAYTYKTLAAVRLRQGDHAGALRAIGQALERARADYGPGHHVTGNVYKDYGLILSAAGRYAEALPVYDQAVRIYTAGEDVFSRPGTLEKVSPKVSLLTTLQGKAAALAKMPGPAQGDAALHTYRQAARLIDHLRLEAHAEGSKLHLAATAVPVFEGGIETACALYRQTGRESYLSDVFAFAEKNKAILLLDALRESSIRSVAAIPPALMALERSLLLDRELYRRKSAGEAQSPAPDSGRLATWRQKLFFLEKRLDSLVTVLEAQHPDYYRLKYDPAPPSLATARARLLAGGRSALLEYFVGAQHIYVLGVTPRRLRLHRLPKDSACLADIRAFREALSGAAVVQEPDASYGRYAAAAYGLFRRLVAPVLPGPAEGVDRLVVVPSDVLGYVPFEALLTAPPPARGSGPAPYLLAQYTVSYGYSAYWLVQDGQAPRRGGAPTEPFAGFAPAFGGGGGAGLRTCDDREAAPLACNRAEVEAISRVLGGRSFLGAASGKAEFLAAAPRYRVLHLATHACLDAGDPLLNRIYFADGTLTAGELYHLPLRAELVVLSACNGGVGKLTRGEGFMSLSRAFAYAGAPSLVVSLWAVDDCATATLMEGFYRHLAAGLPKDEALRRAKLDYLAGSGPLESHPFFWAGFVHAGNPAPLRREATGYGYAWVLAALPVLGAYLLFRRRRAALRTAQ